MNTRNTLPLHAVAVRSDGANMAGGFFFMSTATNLFGWDQPMRPPEKVKAKRGQPKGNASPIGSGPATDIRLKWAACSQWQKEEGS